MYIKLQEALVTLVNQQQTGTTGDRRGEKTRVAMYALRLERDRLFWI